MKNILAIGMLAVFLAGCATSGGLSPGTPPAPPPVTSNQILNKAREIQAHVRTGCSFVPTIQSIVSIISASGGSLLGIANEICMAITSVPLADGGSRKVVVRGVPVSGYRVR